MNNNEFQAHATRLDKLIQRVKSLPDENARATALELLQSLMDLHGAAMSRVVELLSESGDAGRASLQKVADDPLICGLLVLYGVHPVPLEDRVNTAIEKLHPRLRKQNASVDLLGIADDVVRLKLESATNGALKSPEKIRDSLKQAILEAAPEVVEVIIEGVSPSNFVPLNLLQPAAKKENTYEESAA